MGVQNAMKTDLFLRDQMLCSYTSGVELPHEIQPLNLYFFLNKKSYRAYKRTRQNPVTFN